MATIFLLSFGIQAQAQDLNITLANALSPIQPKLPSLTTGDPAFLEVSGVKGPVVKVQPLTPDDIQKLEEEKRKAHTQALLEKKRQRDLSRPKPVESTGRYLPTTDVADDSDEKNTKIHEVKPVSENGHYTVK